MRMSTPCVAEVAHRSGHLVAILAHPEDQVGLRDHVGAMLLREAEHVEGAVVAERRPDAGVESPDRLEVVGEHVRTGVEHRRDVGLSALEVAGEHLHPDPGNGLPDPPDRLRPVRRPSVVEVVSCDAREDDVPQTHASDRLRDPRGLADVEADRAWRSSRRRSHTGACTGSRGSRRWPPAVPSIHRCWGTSPPRTRCAARDRASAPSVPCSWARSPAGPSATAACVHPGR